MKLFAIAKQIDDIKLDKCEHSRLALLKNKTCMKRLDVNLIEDRDLWKVCTGTHIV